MTTPKNYKKKGPSFKERLRCPLCGKLSTIGFFSQDHQFGVYRYRYGGKGDISVNLVQKSSNFMSYLLDGLIDRFLELLEKFAGCKYYSQHQVDEIIDKYEQQLFAEHGARIIPAVGVPTVVPIVVPLRSNIVVPRKVIL